MIRFLVRPMDWVAFGPPRPTSAGETHRRSTDLPGPTTFQGIVRTALLAASGSDFSDRSNAAQQIRDDLVGRPGSLLPGWQLQGPFLTEITASPDVPVARPWVPTPRFVTGSHLDPLFVHLIPSPDVDGRPSALDDVSPDAAPLMLARPREGEIEPLGGWLSPRGLRWALSGEGRGGAWQSSQHARRLPAFVETQDLAGLEIDPDTGTPRDGMLFFGEVLRFKYPCGLAGWLTAPAVLDIPADALTRGDLAACGWKSRPAILEELPAVDPDFQHVVDGAHLPSNASEDQGFFLVALTPVPCGEDHSAVEAAQRYLDARAHLSASVEVEVLAALTGPPRVIGGLEAASKKPRPNRSYWEAGSTWLVVLRGGGDGEHGAAVRGKALRALNNAHVLAGSGEASFGYGHTLVGVGPRVDKQVLQTVVRRKEGRS